MARSSEAARLNTIIRIHREIVLGGYPNCSTLAATFQISTKTVRKYIGMIPDVFRASPIYDETRHGYYFATEREKLPMPVLSDNEVVALFVFEQATRTFKHSPVGDLIEAALDKLALMMPQQCSISFEDVASTLSLRPEKADAFAPTDAETLEQLYRAALCRDSVRIRYRSRENSEVTTRVVNPLHLTKCEGQWYLLAYCQAKKAIRTFVPARILSMKVLSQTFQPPEGFDAETHFRSAFGIVSGMRVADVALRFDKVTATLIKERRWHATQVFEALEDGDLRMRMTCSTGKELIAWILSYGRHVVVEAPVELRDEVREEHLAAAGK